jgi:hypothetical protein
MCDHCASLAGAPSRSKRDRSVTFPCIALQHFGLSALQHLLAMQHPISRCTVSTLREISVPSGIERREKGKRSMALENLILEPELSDLVTSAFEKSWQFVRTDPELAHNDMNEMRALLSRHIDQLAQSGERDLWRLANTAIGQLRRERSAA